MSKPLRRTGKYKQFRCLRCKAVYRLTEEESINGRQLHKCKNCKKELSRDEYEIVEKRFTEFLCERCSSYLPVAKNWVNIDYKDVYCTTCHRIIAFGPRYVHVSNVLKMPQEIVRKNQGNEGSPTLIEVKGDVLHARLRYLNDLARQENKSFHSIDNNLRGYIAFSKDRLLGYLSWNSDQDGTPVIRQIFIIKDSRRNGVASLLVQHFVSRNCDNRKNSQSPFCVESPNDASIGLFKKLGYSDKLVVIQGP